MLPTSLPAPPSPPLPTEPAPPVLPVRPVDPASIVTTEPGILPTVSARPNRAGSTAGSRLTLERATLLTGDGAPVLDDVSLSIGPGELVAIVGASGSGKSTLVEVLAGNLSPSAGRALVDGRPVGTLDAASRREIGYVPQADVLNDDLPLARMLEYAALLRQPAGRSARRRAREAAAQALGHVELSELARTPVRQLSGGQRRRASLAIELLADPKACLLDEPTSGLDPTTAETIVSELRGLADRGRTVVFVTHNPDDLRLCDRIVAVAPGGRVVFDGTPTDAVEVAGSNDTGWVHRRLTSATEPLGPVGRIAPEAAPPTDRGRRIGPSPIGQFAALTARTIELVVRNRLTAAIMAGSPAMVIAMFAILFQGGAFDPAAPSPTSAVMAVFWVAFGGFFFGLTYGLLQLCPEVPIMRRERRAGVAPGLQVLAKLVALTPVLLVTDVAMLAILVGLDRLPAAGLATYTTVAITLALDAVAALALGLLASALVRSPAQASLALPLLCFPAVLFSGAVLPVPVMAPIGRAISAVMPDRWAFEAIGADLGLRPLFADDPSGLGPALLTGYGDTWTGSTTSAWVLLALFIVVLSGATWLALSVRCRQAERGVGRNRSGRVAPRSVEAPDFG